MKLKAKKFLAEARTLIVDPAEWVQGYEATDSDGWELPHVYHHTATCFCSIGAIKRAAFDSRAVIDFNDEEYVYHHAITAMTNAVQSTSEYYDTIEGFNDAQETEHSDVLKMFDHAIANLG